MVSSKVRKQIFAYTIVWLAIELPQYIVVRFSDSDFLRNHQKIELSEFYYAFLSAGRFRSSGKRPAFSASSQYQKGAHGFLLL